MILAVETASTDTSVAIAERDGTPIASDGWSSDRRQGHEILPRLLALLERHGRAMGEVTAVGVGIGPGSFTGLRVGMALGKGLAMGLRVAIVGVPSLAAWLDAYPAAPAALARAGAGEAYVLERGADEPAIVQRDAASRVRGAVAPAELASAFGLTDATSPLDAAAAVARRAAERLGVDPDGDDLRVLEPAYLRAPRGLGQLTGNVEWR